MGRFSFGFRDVEAFVKDENIASIEGVSITNALVPMIKQYREKGKG